MSFLESYHIYLFFYRGDILVFLTGQEEIESLARLVSDCAEHCSPGTVYGSILNKSIK